MSVKEKPVLTFRARIFPFEREILRSVGESLEPIMQKSYTAQVACINKVQRFLKVRWPEAVLFKDKREFILGSGTLRTESLNTEFAVWSVNGHLFSIESRTPLKPFHSATLEEIRSVVIHSELK